MPEDLDQTLGYDPGSVFRDVLREEGVLLELTMRPAHTASFIWGSVNIPPQEVARGRDFFESQCRHEVGHRVVPYAPSTVERSLAAKEVVKEEGIEDTHSFLNVVFDLMVDGRNLARNPGVYKPYMEYYTEYYLSSPDPRMRLLGEVGKLLLRQRSKDKTAVRLYDLLFRDGRRFYTRLREAARLLHPLFSSVNEQEYGTYGSAPHNPNQNQQGEQGEQGEQGQQGQQGEDQTQGQQGEDQTQGQQGEGQGQNQNQQEEQGEQQGGTSGGSKQDDGKENGGNGKDGDGREDGDTGSSGAGQPGASEDGKAGNDKSGDTGPTLANMSGAIEIPDLDNARDVDIVDLARELQEAGVEVQPRPSNNQAHRLWLTYQRLKLLDRFVELTENVGRRESTSEVPEVWRPGDDPARLDLVDTIQRHGMAIPGVTTLKRGEGRLFGTGRAGNVMLILDNSGSTGYHSRGKKIIDTIREAAFCITETARRKGDWAGAVAFGDGILWDIPMSNTDYDPLVDQIIEMDGDSGSTILTGAVKWVLDQIRGKPSVTTFLITDGKVHDLDKVWSELEEIHRQGKLVIFLIRRPTDAQADMERYTNKGFRVYQIEAGIEFSEDALVELDEGE